MAETGVTLASSLDAAPGGASLALLVVDDELRCLEVNLAACRLFGTSRQRLLGKRFNEMLASDMADRLEKVWQAFRHSGGHAGPFDVRLDGASASRVDISVTSGILPGRHLLIVMPAASRDSQASGDSHPEWRRPSARELEVLEQLAGGATDGQIAARLKLSPATVQTHVRNAKAKLGARTRAQAVALALREGLIAPS